MRKTSAGRAPSILVLEMSTLASLGREVMSSAVLFTWLFRNQSYSYSFIVTQSSLHSLEMPCDSHIPKVPTTCQAPARGSVMRAHMRHQKTSRERLTDAYAPAGYSRIRGNCTGSRAINIGSMAATFFACVAVARAGSARTVSAQSKRIRRTSDDSAPSCSAPCLEDICRATVTSHAITTLKA